MTDNESPSTKADAIRAQIGAADPHLLALLDECKGLFGARLLAIDCGGVVRGDPRSDACLGVRLPPAPGNPAEEYAAWEEACRAQQARAGAYRGTASKRYARAR